MLRRLRNHMCKCRAQSVDDLRIATIKQLETQITSCLLYSNDIENEIQSNLCTVGLLRGPITKSEEQRVNFILKENAYLKQQLSRSRAIMHALVKQKHFIQQANLNREVVHLLSDINTLVSEFDLNNVTNVDEMFDKLEENHSNFCEVSERLAEQSDDYEDSLEEQTAPTAVHNLPAAPTRKESVSLPEKALIAE